MMTKKIKCAATDCEIRFTPKRDWQKFHSKTCKNRELQRRHRAEKEKATHV